MKTTIYILHSITYLKNIRCWKSTATRLILISIFIIIYQQIYKCYCHKCFMKNIFFFFSSLFKNNVKVITQ